MRLDATSRLHLRILATHLTIILVFALPILLLDASWHGLLARLAASLRLAAASLAFMALVARHPWPRRSFCLWDEVTVLCALALLCALVLPAARVAEVQDASHVSAPP